MPPQQPWHFPSRGATVAIQGFGAVGRAAAGRLVELGAVITAVSTAKGAVVDKDGIDVLRLAALSLEFGDALRRSVRRGVRRVRCADR